MVIELAELENEYAVMTIPDEGTIREYYELRQNIATYTSDMRSVISLPNYCVRYIQPGRLVQIQYMDYDFGWGAVVSCQKRKSPRNAPNEEYPPHESFIVDVLLQVAEGSSSPTRAGQQPLPPGIRPSQPEGKSKLEVVPVLLSCLKTISHLRIRLPQDLKPTSARSEVKKHIVEIQRRFPDGIPLLDPIEDMGIKDDSFRKLLRVRAAAVLNFSPPTRPPLRFFSLNKHVLISGAEN